MSCAMSPRWFPSEAETGQSPCARGRPEPLTVDVDRAADVGAAQALVTSQERALKMRVVHGGPVHLYEASLMIWPRLAVTQALGLVWTSHPGAGYIPPSWKMRPGEGRVGQAPKGHLGSLHRGATSGAWEGSVVGW